MITSYGITRLDVELLQQFYFNYVILDESQVIKNPTSNILESSSRVEVKTQAGTYRYADREHNIGSVVADVIYQPWNSWRPDVFQKRISESN